MKQKNVLAIHDISCVGRCSLTVALPIISAYGIEVRNLPTALLSTHTGGFEGFTYLDLSDEMVKILEAWKPLKLVFDGIYSGFLSSAGQIDTVKRTIDDYRAANKNCVSFVDPVMADNGTLYKIFDDAFVRKMSELIPYADVIMPNITEAAFLTGTKYRDAATPEYIDELIDGLVKRGASDAVITGVSFAPDKLGVAVRSKGKKTEYYFGRKIDGYYHGTGDIFGSVLTAVRLGGAPLMDAAKSAADFVIGSIENTPKTNDLRFGVEFEKMLCKR